MILVFAECAMLAFLSGSAGCQPFYGAKTRVERAHGAHGAPEGVERCSPGQPLPLAMLAISCSLSRMWLAVSGVHICATNVRQVCAGGGYGGRTAAGGL